MEALVFDELKDSDNFEALAHAVCEEAQDGIARSDLGQLTGFKITEEQLTVVAVETFFGEVENGGFDQYFCNQGFRITPYAEASLRRVGLDKYVDIMAKAAKVWPKGVIPTSESEYEADYETACESADEPWGDCDRAVYALMFAEEAKGEYEFRVKLHAYIIARRQQFVD